MSFLPFKMSNPFPGSILDNIEAAHEVGFGEGTQKVEKILLNDQYLNRKSGTLQNMEFEMFNTLLNDNIMVGKDLFLTNVGDQGQD